MCRPVVLLFFAAVLCAQFILSGCGTKGPDPHALELQGNYAKALAHYTEDLVKTSTLTLAPGRDRARVTAPQVWDKQVQSYVDLVCKPAGRGDAAFDSAFAGTLRCIPYVDTINYVKFTAVAPASESDFQGQWKQLFIPEEAQMPPAQQHLAEQVRQSRCSFLTFSTPRDFSYSVHLLDPVGRTRTHLSLKPEAQLTALVHPGTYYVLVVSSVVFASRDKWQSPMTVSVVQIPEESSIIAASLHTEVRRGVKSRTEAK